jgi:superfamily II RNA helicase
MENKDTEEMLFSNASLEDLIKMKIENELNEELTKLNTKPSYKVYTDIKDVPRELIFSAKATYKLFNRRNKTETFINGLQAEALIGTEHAIRAKVSTGELSAFATDDAYVKFEKACETV